MFYLVVYLVSYVLLAKKSLTFERTQSVVGVLNTMSISSLSSSDSCAAAWEFYSLCFE